MDGKLRILRGPVLEQEQLQGEAVGITLHGGFKATMAHLYNLSTEQRSRISAFMRDFELTWDAIDATMDTAIETVPFFRKRGDTTEGSHFWSVEYCSWLSKCGWYLCAAEPGVSATEVASSLPSIDDIILMNPGTDIDCLGTWEFTHLSLNVALVWEKIGRPAEALRYAAVVLENSSAMCGTNNPSTRATALLVQGRAHAALGHVQAAGKAFEAAVALFHEYGLYLLKALALKDFKLAVLDALGHADHATRRLGEALRLLVASAETLTPLMDGLDVAKLLRMSPPDPQYRIHYTSDGDDDGVSDVRDSGGNDVAKISHTNTLPEGTPPPQQWQKQFGGDDGSETTSSTHGATLTSRTSTRTLTLLITSTFFPGKKKLRVSVGSMDELTSALQASLRLGADESFAIVIHDDDFEEDRTVVDLDDLDTDKAKIQLLKL